jgi:hypothetical protein
MKKRAGGVIPPALIAGDAVGKLEPGLCVKRGRTRRSGVELRGRR